MERSKRKAGRGALELLGGADSDEYYEAPVRTPKAMKSDKVEKVRVWWPPTRDKERTGFSGAYWPASVQRKGTNFLEVQYDNGEREKVDPDNIFPFDVPIEFGKESSPLVVGEFVEVSNNSKTDPCAWVGCVESIGKKCLITYPFHDSPKELIKQELLRRARVWDDLDWKYIEVGQRWKAGEVTSPIELNLLTEEEYYRHLKQLNGKSSGGKGSRGKKPAAAAAPPSESEGSDSVQQDDSSSGEEQQPPPKKQSTGRQRGRPRKPQHPTRSRLDEASNGTRETKEEKPTGARKRKPAAVRQEPAHTDSSSQEKDAKDVQQQQQSGCTQLPNEVAVTEAAAAEKIVAAATANEAAAAAAGKAEAAAAEKIVAAAAAGKAAPGAAAAAAASGPAGSAAAPVTLTELMQGLNQPVLLLPAAAGQQTPMMLLLPKGTDPAGLAGIGSGAGPVSLQGAGVGAAAAVAAQGLGRGQRAGGAGAPGSSNSQGSGRAAAARAGALQQQAQLAAVAAAAAQQAALNPRGTPALLSLFPSGTSQAAAAAEVDSQLALLDMTAARLALAQRYSSEAYLLLVDCWRAGSPRLPDALRSFKANVLSLLQPDYQAFMVGIFGMDRMKALELQQQ